MAHKKGKKLAEITNTPRNRKLMVEEPEKCTIVPDEEILSLHLDVSESEEFAEVGGHKNFLLHRPDESP